MISMGTQLRPRLYFVLFGLAVLVVGATSSSAQTPNHRGRPLYGSATLAAGFSTRPRTVEITAGGRSRNPIPGDGCVGYIATPQPDYLVTYTAGPAFNLDVFATSESDTALLVRAPDGHWACNDDADGNNPRIVFESPSSGTYHIWVATFDPTPARATLGITESRYDPNALASGLNLRAPPFYGEISLRAGFPSPHTIEVMAGGTTANPVSGAGCVGYVTTAQSDVRMTYAAVRSGSLEIYAESDTDTVLLVRLPGGTWLCNDDADGRNPAITLERPLSGVYHIWVGTYSSGTNEATLGFRAVNSAGK
jgi:hypothetical protein